MCIEEFRSTSTMISVMITQADNIESLYNPQYIIIRYSNNHHPFWFKVQEQICWNTSAIILEIESYNRTDLLSDFLQSSTNVSFSVTANCFFVLIEDSTPLQPRSLIVSNNTEPELQL